MVDRVKAKHNKLQMVCALRKIAAFAALFAGLFGGAATARAQNLETVLNKMDAASEAFRTTQADFSWDQYQLVVNETDVQEGTIYFRRGGNETQMAADIRQPDARYVIFSEGKLRMFQPKADQVTEYNTSAKNRSEIESFLVLGFGGRGHELSAKFDLKYDGMEKIEGVDTWKIELTPKSAKMQSWFKQIVLWIDTTRGVSIQQKFLQPGGDYKLAHYRKIEVNQKLPEGVFKLKTTNKTKYIQAN